MRFININIMLILISSSYCMTAALVWSCGSIAAENGVGMAAESLDDVCVMLYVTFLKTNRGGVLTRAISPSYLPALCMYVCIILLACSES